MGKIAWARETILSWIAAAGDGGCIASGLPRGASPLSWPSSSEEDDDSDDEDKDDKSESESELGDSDPSSGDIMV